MFGITSITVSDEYNWTVGSFTRTDFVVFISIFSDFFYIVECFYLVLVWVYLSEQLWLFNGQVEESTVAKFFPPTFEYRACVSLHHPGRIKQTFNLRR